MSKEFRSHPSKTLIVLIASPKLTNRWWCDAGDLAGWSRTCANQGAVGVAVRVGHIELVITNAEAIRIGQEIWNGHCNKEHMFGNERLLLY